jgi:hypothetical protein
VSVGQLRIPERHQFCEFEMPSSKLCNLKN